ncbi:MAG: transposase [Candidatus Omnitrophica bacterium]|nr:transposase [Candidatus Omnitrophota bacterium]
MPRIERGLVDGFIYHVLNRGNGKQEIFHKDQDYKVFIELMQEAKKKHPVKIFEYCLMPNHFHMVMMVVQAEEFIRYMQWLMTSHVRKYHAHYGSTGHIWQGRYKSFIIQEGGHLLTVLRYVIRNPVRAGLVKSAKEWRWASHNGSVNPASHNLLLDKVPIELPEKWDEYVNEPLTDAEIERLHSSITRGSPYGETDWREKVSKELRLESTIRPRGRPRKDGGGYKKK